MSDTTTVVITRATRRRLSDLQALIRLESGGHVDVDTVINRALDRSDELARLIKTGRIGAGDMEST